MAKAKRKEVISLEEKLEQALVPVDEQPYEVPDNWRWVKVGSVCVFENGYAFKSDKFSQQGTIPVIRISNIKQNEIDIDSCVYTTETDVDNRFIAKYGDLLIAMSGATTGKNGVFLSNVPAYVNQRVGNIKVKDERVLLPAYRNYYIMAMEEEILRGAYGGAQPNISSNKICNMNMPLAPIAEQQRIVEQIERLFSKLEEAKGKVQDVLENYEIRKSAILHKAFAGEMTEKWRRERNIDKETWLKKPFGELVVDVRLGLVRGKAEQSCDKKYPYFKMNNITADGNIDLEGLVYVEAEEDEVKLYTLQNGDFLFNTRNSYELVGKNCVWNQDGVSAMLYNNNIMRVRFAKGINPFYVSFYLNSIEGKRALEKVKKNTTNVAAIYAKDLNNINITLAPKEEQDVIVELLQKMFTKEDCGKALTERFIEQIDMVKKAILAKAFRGELGTNNSEEDSTIELLKSVLSQE